MSLMILAAVTIYPLLVGSVGGGFMYSGGPDYYHANSGHDFPSVVCLRPMRFLLFGSLT